jgi:Uncharacterized protein conserved in bacteria (DUF2188)
MNVFVVYPGARAGWELLREGEPGPLHFDDREAAIRYARCLADVNRPSALKVETSFGGVEASWFFRESPRT